MRKILVLFITLFILHSCKNNTVIENQVSADLVGMLHNKAEVKEIFIKQVSKTTNQTQTVLFDCTLNFIDDLYKDNGELAFSKGMKVKEKNNKFVYIQTGSTLKLIRLEFGETDTVIFDHK